MSKATWITGAALVACTGMIGYALTTGTAGAATTDGAATKAAAGGAPATTAPAAPETTTAPETTAPPKRGVPAKTPATRAAKLPKVLSGKRQVAIVRVQSFESAVSLLDSGRLGEVDGDEGRTLFVPTPLGRGKFLIKAFPETGGGEPDCWGVYNPQTTEPLSVRAVACDASDRNQHFTIARSGSVYVISNSSAYLQYSPTRGLILEELGDAPLETTFRIVDNGAAPTYGD